MCSKAAFPKVCQIFLLFNVSQTVHALCHLQQLRKLTICCPFVVSNYLFVHFASENIIDKVIPRNMGGDCTVVHLQFVCVCSYCKSLYKNLNFSLQNWHVHYYYAICLKNNLENFRLLFIVYLWTRIGVPSSLLSHKLAALCYLHFKWLEFYC